MLKRLLLTTVLALVAVAASAQQTNVGPGEFRRQINTAVGEWIEGTTFDTTGSCDLGTDVAIARCNLGKAFSSLAPIWPFRLEEHLCQGGSYTCHLITGNPDNVGGPGFFGISIPATIDEAEITSEMNNLARQWFCPNTGGGC